MWSFAISSQPDVPAVQPTPPQAVLLQNVSNSVIIPGFKLLAPIDWPPPKAGEHDELIPNVIPSAPAS